MPYMVAVAVAGRERDCKELVRDQGFDPYMPTYRERVVKSGKKRWVERLYLGRYFFARWHEGCPWRSLISLTRAERPLISGLFMWRDPDRPALVRDAEVERIRASEGPSGHVGGVARDAFASGQAIRAVLGVMAGAQGFYVGSGRGGCDVAMIELFGRQTRVEFAPGVLQAA